MFKTPRCGARRIWAMFPIVILLAGQAMAVMDGSILVVASPSLQDSLHANSAELQLVVAVYTIAFASLVVIGSRLGDIVGRRRAFISGLATFTLASLVGGLAPTPAILIGARAIQGAAAALMTPQVLSTIQAQYEGEQRARAIGAYSMILAVGVAAGQILGGLLVTAHLLAAAWRPALLLNAPVGVVLLAASHARLPRARPTGRERLDLSGVGLLSAALVLLVVPLTFGRDYAWPAWVWPCLAGCAAVGAAFVALEVRLAARGRRPLIDLRLFALPSVAAGVGAVLLITAAYAGFLLSLTLRLQDGLHFSPLHAGLIFAIYATGFATASLSWTRAPTALRDRLPLIGPLLMGGSLLVVGLMARSGAWPLGRVAPFLFAAGAGHAYGFSPLTNHLSGAIAPTQVADLSGLILTASLVGQVIGVAAFVGVYLSAASHGGGHALALTTVLLCAVLLATAACARRAVAPARVRMTGSRECA
jgi:MFS family permease